MLCRVSGEASLNDPLVRAVGRQSNFVRYILTNHMF